MAFNGVICPTPIAVFSQKVIKELVLLNIIHQQASYLLPFCESFHLTPILLINGPLSPSPLEPHTMVWVLNNTSGNITVSVTATSGGDPGDFVITTATLPNMGQNHWKRTATETLNATLTNGKTYTGGIGPNDQITIYNDAVVIIAVTNTSF
ncbi:hypothetical protein M422DRAFT_257509 [Sphaerobolus stellatus SS14]|uniref:Unplaced genomic scaffold SPHSTscaffold_75, whole genome shotgun sequence n=1 Tax=Sphaerobolus stellatus (strain SS14) TaxID=990650 RepID=A0A0C9VPA4_SPHS4|nr:hypothetical protein M422DRAFT_276383 [Sphaerobolus stellatus SS14]KIJ39681.1 hypothetical protein M422DRAFT_257509 [Sphaerobolus stellatus SS14]